MMALDRVVTMADHTEPRGRHHPVDWEKPEHPLAQQEPRHGRRAVLAATVDAPDGPVVVYCLHLEVPISPEV